MTFGILVALCLLTYHPSEQPGNVRIGQIDNQLGIAGVYISYFLIQLVIGLPSVVFPIIVFVWGWNVFRGHSLSKWTLLFLLLAVYTSIILALPEIAVNGHGQPDFSKSGLVGGVVAQFLLNYLGLLGSIVVILSVIMITVVGATDFSFANGLSFILQLISTTFTQMKFRLETWNERSRRKARSAKSKKENERDALGESADETRNPVEPTVQVETPKERKPLISQATEEAKAVNTYIGIPKSTLEQTSAHAKSSYEFPSSALLQRPDREAEQVSEQELIGNGKILEERLLEFGVQGTVVEINPGPVITRYELEPAPGVKLSRITALADDLALAVRAKSIRIVAPIPGKGAVGIEIPNKKPSVVYLKEVIDSVPFRDSNSPLTLALGKTISGQPFVTRLDQMPHLLIAGATGSGKSICLNSIITSILFKAHPTEVNFVMLDPKRLELSIYSNLRHHHLNYREDLDEEVVTNANNAISVLRSIEVLMEERYEILARAGVRNIGDYNQRLKNGQLQSIDNEEPFEPLSYIVVIVDELADLMLTAAREVEEPIARLTQMSRAVGIHLILATQRPSVDVITGVIKANFPARIAFQVASKTDSRTILDLNGAENLLGRGDMLFIPPGSHAPVRIHGTYVSTEEIEGIIAHIRKQPRYPKKLLPVGQEDPTGFGDTGLSGSGRDALFNEALKLVVRHQQGSISLLQRRLKVGYARAARIIDELEAAGVVGAFDGSKAREVLIGEEELEDMLQY